MQWDVVFSEEQQERWRRKKNEGRLRLECGVCRSGDHMSHFAPCMVIDGLGFMLNNHVGVENKPSENPEERVVVRTGVRLKRPHVSLNNSSVITPTIHINTHEVRHKHVYKNMKTLQTVCLYLGEFCKQKVIYCVINQKRVASWLIFRY